MVRKVIYNNKSVNQIGAQCLITNNAPELFNFYIFCAGSNE